MIVANQKLKDNIVEYILYMWQLEDIVRVLKFDMNQIDKNLISKYDTNRYSHVEITAWYKELIDSMNSEGIEKEGHLEVTKKHINTLSNIHLNLLKSDSNYLSLYNDSKSAVEELNKKSGIVAQSAVETILNFLFGILILRLKKQKISTETSEYISSFSKILSILGKNFHNK